MAGCSEPIAPTGLAGCKFGNSRACRCFDLRITIEHPDGTASSFETRTGRVVDLGGLSLAVLEPVYQRIYHRTFMDPRISNRIR